MGRLRRRCNRFGTQVHPADLDGALQQTALIAEDTDAGETRLPFMVGEATLTSAKGRMCSIVERQGATSAGVWLAGLCKGDAPLVRLNSFESRVFKALAAPVATRQQHMYVTQWEAQDAPVGDLAHAPSLVLGSRAAYTGAELGAYGVAAAASSSSLMFALPLSSAAATP